jgi:hypothetical protein
MCARYLAISTHREPGASQASVASSPRLRELVRASRHLRASRICHALGSHPALPAPCTCSQSASRSTSSTVFRDARGGSVSLSVRATLGRHPWNVDCPSPDHHVPEPASGESHFRPTQTLGPGSRGENALDDRNCVVAALGIVHGAAAGNQFGSALRRETAVEQHLAVLCTIAFDGLSRVQCNAVCRAAQSGINVISHACGA